MPRYIDESKGVGPDGWTGWIKPVMNGYKMMCCDCGLVHVFDFRIEPGDSEQIEYRVRRDNRATGQTRRKRNR